MNFDWFYWIIANLPTQYNALQRFMPEVWSVLPEIRIIFFFLLVSKRNPNSIAFGLAYLLRYFSHHYAINRLDLSLFRCIVLFYLLSFQADGLTADRTVIVEELSMNRCMLWLDLLMNRFWVLSDWPLSPLLHSDSLSAHRQWPCRLNPISPVCIGPELNLIVEHNSLFTMVFLSDSADVYIWSYVTYVRCALP